MMAFFMLAYIVKILYDSWYGINKFSEIFLLLWTLL
jgi:hypothetical protein